MKGQTSSTTTIAFVCVTTLFFAWGFITALVDPLVAAVKGIFTLTDVQAQLAAFAFFIAYGVCSFPAASLLARLKSIPTILIALCTMIVGCLVMLAAANLAIFTLVLIGLFILASGITILQVAANPLAAALGDPRYSHFRLTLSQTFNSLGTFLAPLIGAHLFLEGVEVKPGTVVTEAVRQQALGGIDSAYLWICGLIALLALFFFFSRSVVTRAAPPSTAEARGSLGAMIADAFSSRWALFGALAIFLYVGAEVAIGTQMALFLNNDAIWGQSNAPFSVPLLGFAMGSDGVPGVSLQEAGKAVAFYWGGAMVGRAIGSVLLGFVRAWILLALFTAIAAGMCAFVVVVGGVDAGFVALAIGLFNSIMFPVIFTLTLERSTASQEATSGLLCTAIIGGAILPLLVGLVSEANGYAFALIVPAACYVALCLFAIAAGRARVAKREGEPAVVSLH
ncbi:MAG: MFS transporter [Sphingomonas sp.]